MDWILFHIYGYQNGNRRCSSRTWKYAPVFDCKYGQPCDSFVGSIDFCTAFRHCICMACSSGRLARQLCNFLCGTEKILAEKCFGAGNSQYLKKQKKRTGNCIWQAENRFKQAYRTLKRNSNTSDYRITQRAIFR